MPKSQRWLIAVSIVVSAFIGEFIVAAFTNGPMLPVQYNSLALCIAGCSMTILTTWVIVERHHVRHDGRVLAELAAMRDVLAAERHSGYADGYADGLARRPADDGRHLKPVG